MRKLAITLGVIVLLIIVVVLLLPMFLDVNRYHDTIQGKLQQRLGRLVSLGQMHLSLVPLAFRVENAVVGEDPRFGSKPFASADQLYVTAELMPLFHGEVNVNAIEMRQPKIELIKNQQGEWNFSTLGKPAPAAQAQ